MSDRCFRWSTLTSHRCSVCHGTRVRSWADVTPDDIIASYVTYVCIIMGHCCVADHSCTNMSRCFIVVIYFVIVKVRQTDEHGRAHSAFFAAAPNKQALSFVLYHTHPLYAEHCVLIYGETYIKL